MKELDIMSIGPSFAHFTLTLLLHYLVKCRIRFWPFTIVNSYWVVHVLTWRIIVELSDLNLADYTVWSKVCFRSKSILTRCQTLTN